MPVFKPDFINLNSVTQKDSYFELNEGNWSKIMKGVKSGSAPFSIVAIENSWPKPKVLGQEIDIKIPDAIPAHYEGMKKKFSKANLISIEDATGKVVYSEKL